LQWRLFWDTALHTTCVVHPTTDGKLRCIPDGRADLAFRDAACTEPILYLYDGRPETAFAVEFGPCNAVARV
jgi:hypothetical protein